MPPEDHSPESGKSRLPDGTVDALAQLAKLSLSESEQAELRPQLEKVIAYLQCLAEFESSGAQGRELAPELESYCAQDEAQDGEAARAVREAMLDGAPRLDEGAIVVPQVVEG